MILAKAIKPKKLNDKAMHAVFVKEANSIADEIEKDFQKTTKSWNRKVRFVKIVAISKNKIEILVGTDDEIYRYVTEGTRPHVILPKNAPALRFQRTYKAKTTPGVIGSSSGGSSGPTVFSSGVIHPGTKARNFDDAIAKRWKKRFKRRMEAAMREAVKVSGHAI